jgi:hypothetical protein
MHMRAAVVIGFVLAAGAGLRTLRSATFYELGMSAV